MHRILMRLTCAAALLLAGGVVTQHHQTSTINEHSVQLSGASPSATTASTTTAPKPAPRYSGRVVRIQDGDTFIVRLRNGQRHYVRVLGIDTPETIHGAHECGGHTASVRLRHLLPRGTKVLLRADPAQPRTDRYHRMLRYVRRSSDSLDVGRAQLERGLAEVYVYRNGNFEKRHEYGLVERDAKKAHVGIWGRC